MRITRALPAVALAAALIGGVFAIPAQGVPIAGYAVSTLTDPPPDPEGTPDDEFPRPEEDPNPPQEMPPPDDCSLRSCVVQIARVQLTTASRNREASGNCNYYSGYWGNSGSNTCSKTTDGVKWRSNNWCADFARYVWYKGGANKTGLDAWAGSFYRTTVGTSNWHWRWSSYTPRPGDAVVFDWNDGTTNRDYTEDHQGWNIDHVGIVESYNASTGQLTIIEGNTAPTKTSPEGIYRRYRSTGDVIGYASPR